MEITPKDYPTALVHLYRGEIGRMVVYRARLDTTTHWAVGTTAAMVSFALGNAQVPHFVFVLALFLNLMFLWMEARRYRYYELIRGRVRWLESGFYAQVLLGASTDWQAPLRESLIRPRLPISHLQALSVRLRRNYLWLLAVVYAGWLLKLDLHSASFISGARIGPLPGFWVLILALLLFLALVAISLHYRPLVALRSKHVFLDE